MPETSNARSPELMTADDTALVVVDVQEKLLPAVQDVSGLLWNVRRLLDAAALFNIPNVVTEQYPKGLGATHERLASRATVPVEKLSFSCWGAAGFRDALTGLGRPKVLLCGMETHVCVQQTALDLLSEGFHVYLAVDAVSCRFAADGEIALRRMECSGVTLTSTEAVLFEWCERAGTTEFRGIRDLVTEKKPAG